MTRILLLLEQGGNRRILQEWLGGDHEVVVESPSTSEGNGAVLEQAFDLCLVDLPAMHRLAASLRQRKQREQPLFLPVLLLTSRVDAERAPPQLWDDIDDVVSLPVLKRVLHGRVASLLRARRLSLMAHAELDQIFQSAGGAMCVVDRARRVRRVNQAFVQLLGGGEPLASVGRDVSQVLQEAGFRSLVADAGQHPLSCVLAGGEACDGEVTLEGPKGSQRSFLLATTAFRGLDGELLGAIMDFRDITPLKKTEANLREHQARLEDALAALHLAQQHLVRQERLNALAEMASGVAHDFNNSLSVILGYTQMLLKESEHNSAFTPDVQGCLEAIATAARDAAHIVKGLRGFYRPRQEFEPFQRVDLNSIIEDAIRVTKPKWHDEVLLREACIHIERNLEPLPRLLGHAAELREALINFVFNAVDAMPQGGVLSFRTWTEGDWVLLSVTDSGVGMSEEIQKRAFEPFFTTKGEHGTGMGLAMVYGIAERHGGSVRVQSAQGRGTTVIMRLPLEPSAGRGDEPTPAGDQVSTRLRPLRLLVVDDHPGVRQALQAELSTDGHEVVQARHGLEALDLFQDSAFDAVITDWAMPELSGERLAAVIKATSPRTPVIVMTGFFEGVGSPPAQPANVDRVLRKPVSPLLLREALQALCESSNRT